MRISTIITYYKGSLKYLNDLIISLEKAILKAKEIEKNLSNEIIIVNDSAEEIYSRKIINMKRGLEARKISNIKIIENEKNFGIVKSRKIGLENSDSSDLIHIIDQDDMIDEYFYFNSLKIFKKYDKQIVQVASKTIYIDSAGKRIKERFISRVKKDLLTKENSLLLKKYIYADNPIVSIGNYVYHGKLNSKIIDYFSSIGDDISGSDDYLLALYLIGNNIPFFFNDKMIFLYRIHNYNISNFLRNEFYDKNQKGFERLYYNGIFSREEYLKAKKVFTFLREYNNLKIPINNIHRKYKIIKVFLKYFPESLFYIFFRKVFWRIKYKKI